MSCILLFDYWFSVSVWVIWVEDFVAPHDGDEVFGITEVDDVVGVQNARSRAKRQNSSLIKIRAR